MIRSRIALQCTATVIVSLPVRPGRGARKRGVGILADSAPAAVSIPHHQAAGASGRRRQERRAVGEVLSRSLSATPDPYYPRALSPGPVGLGGIGNVPNPAASVRYVLPGKGQVFHSEVAAAELRSWPEVQEGFDILVDTTGEIETFKAPEIVLIIVLL